MTPLGPDEESDGLVMVGWIVVAVISTIMMVHYVCNEAMRFGVPQTIEEE